MTSEKVLLRLSMAMAVLLMLSGCTHLMFVPMKQHVLTPAKVELEYSDISIVSHDGLKLHGWYLPSTGKPEGAVLFLHGNGENISTHLATVYWLPAEGYEVFMLDYRGYGLSEGKPDLDGSALDVEAALEYAVQNKTSKDKLIVLGHSFGGSIGIYAVAHSQYKKDILSMITIGAFSDYRDITQDALSTSWLTWLFQWPLSFTIDNDLSPQKFVDKIAPVPLFIMHSKQDEIVPYYHAEVLFEHARTPKSLEAVSGDHNHVFRIQGNRQIFLNYLEGLQ